MLDWFRRIMIGRYGVDQLTWALVAGYFTCRLLWLLTHWGWLTWAGLLLLLVAAGRIFSRNFPRRQAENRTFLRVWYRLCTFGRRLQETIARWRGWMAAWRTHKIFSCPSCHQKLRVPRGRSKIAISCPKCHTQFIRKT